MTTLFDIFKYFWDLIMIPINKMFDLYIDILPNVSVSVGVLVVAFIGTAGMIYFTFRALSIIKGGNE